MIRRIEGEQDGQPARLRERAQKESRGTAVVNGRDRGGRFSKGNPGGPGNPHASKVSRLRSALLEAVSADDIRSVIDALVTEAKTGNVPAIREFFNRVLGQSQAIDAIERLAEVEATLERLEASTAPDLIP